jgi:predicted DNA-binding protein
MISTSNAAGQTPDEALADSATSLQARADDFAQRATKEKAGAQKDALSARSKELGDFAIEARDILRRYRAGKLEKEV